VNLRTRIVIAASAALVLLSPTLAAQERLTLGACIDATLSRACLDLNNKERKRHFFAALWLLQQGLVVPDNFTGSWAGASGLTQFMPATFVAHMESASGTGAVDIVGSLMRWRRRPTTSRAWDEPRACAGVSKWHCPREPCATWFAEPIKLLRPRHPSIR
jgi:hypothetical protein